MHSSVRQPKKAKKAALPKSRQHHTQTPNKMATGIPLFLKSSFPTNKSAIPTIQRADLKSAPVSAREKLTFASSPIKIEASTIDQYFDKSNGKWSTTKGRKSDVTLELNGIDEAYSTPMRSLAMELSDSLYTSPTDGKLKRIFGQNKIVSVHLALKKHGLADGTYRFAWTSDTKKQTLYISGPTTEAKALSTVKDARGKLSAAGSTFKYSGWGKDEKKALLRAIALTPPKVLKRIDGATFKLKSGASSTIGEDGEYNEDTHTITVFTSAFKADNRRRAGNDTHAVWTIVHEMGHAADLTALRQAWATNNKRKRLKPRAESGSQWSVKAKVWTIKDRPLNDKKKKADTAFIKAAIADGIDIAKGATTLKQGLTEYSNTNWLELYAETYALFVTDPNTLELLRPKIYTYFKKKFM